MTPSVYDKQSGHTLYLVISASDINRGFSAGFGASAMVIYVKEAGICKKVIVQKSTKGSAIALAAAEGRPDLVSLLVQDEPALWPSITRTVTTNPVTREYAL